MEKARVVAANSKRGKKESKNKKKVQPLKVVYITNPMKFTATASEFRALVQELTGKYADIPDSSRFAAAEGGAAKEGSVHAAAEVVGQLQGEGEGGGGAEKGTSDLSTTSGSYEDEGFFYTPEMIDNFQGLEASRLWHHDEDDVDGDDDLDVFKRLGAM